MRYTKGACPPIACGHASFAILPDLRLQSNRPSFSEPIQDGTPLAEVPVSLRGAKGANALPVEPEASQVEQCKRGKDHAHGQGLAAAEPLVKQPDTQQGDQHDGAHAVGGVGDDGRHVVERKQQKTGGEVIGRANEQAKEEVGSGERLTPGDAHGHAKQQGGDEGDEQKGVLERSLSERLEDFGGSVRAARPTSSRSTSPVRLAAF